MRPKLHAATGNGNQRGVRPFARWRPASAGTTSWKVTPSLSELYGQWLRRFPRTMPGYLKAEAAAGLEVKSFRQADAVIADKDIKRAIGLDLQPPLF